MTDEKVARKDIVDNSRLEELINGNADFKTDDEFLEVFRDSRLFLPVVFRKLMPADGIIEEQFGIEINYFPAAGQGKAILLFTSVQELEKYTPSASIGISMCDLAEILRQSDSYLEVVLNMKRSFHIPLDEFLDLFGIIGNYRMGDIKAEGLDGLADDEIRERLLSSDVIVPCCDGYHGMEFY